MTMIKEVIHKLLTGSKPETPPPAPEPEHKPSPDEILYGNSVAWQEDRARWAEIQAMCGSNSDKK